MGSWLLAVGKILLEMALEPACHKANRARAPPFRTSIIDVNQ